jgi:hypothetical protein
LFNLLATDLYFLNLSEDSSGGFHGILDFILIICFHFYTALVFNPEELADNIKVAVLFQAFVLVDKQLIF